MEMKRSAGILLPVFSLPGPYGIGTLGKEARSFADFLKAAGQRWGPGILPIPACPPLRGTPCCWTWKPWRRRAC